MPRILGYLGTSNLVHSSSQETRIYRLPSRTGRVYRIRTRYVPTVVGFLWSRTTYRGRSPVGSKTFYSVFQFAQRGFFWLATRFPEVSSASFRHVLGGSLVYWNPQYSTKSSTGMYRRYLGTVHGLFWFYDIDFGARYSPWYSLCLKVYCKVDPKAREKFLC